MVEVLVYGVRHIPTDKLMPLTKHHRGFTWWDPWVNASKRFELGIPRLFLTKAAAAQAARTWLDGMYVSTYYDGEFDGLEIKEDRRRRKEDIQIVTLSISDYPIQNG